MIYIVNGAPGSGKTTFEDIVQTLMGPAFCTKISTIDFVKDIARQCGWDGTKDLHNRKFLSDLKQLLVEWNQVPYKKVTKAIQDFERDLYSYDINPDGTAIFVDCREPEEIAKFVADGARTILIKRDSAEQAQTSNQSDANVLNYIYDIIIDNNSDIASLQQKALNFIHEEKLYIINEEFQLDIFGNIKIPL